MEGHYISGRQPHTRACMMRGGPYGVAGCTCGIPAPPALALPKAVATVQAIAGTYALTPCPQPCVCGACAAPLPDGHRGNPDALCPRCRAAGCDPLLGIAHCQEGQP